MKNVTKVTFFYFEKVSNEGSVFYVKRLARYAITLYDDRYERIELEVNT